MAGFFSLGGGGGGGGGGGVGGRGSTNSPPHNNNNNEDDDDHHPSSADIGINPHSQGLFWAPYKNDQPTHNPYKPSSSSSFELWQTQDHLHHHHHHQQFNLYQHHHHRQQQQQDLYTSAAALGVGPTANPILDAGGSEHHLHPPQARATTSGSGSGGVSCQDCGNQAKKDCVHMRCRTCCKSRGFDCATHIKSTWVPAAKRRERQQLQQPGHHHHHHLHHHDHDSDDHNNNNNQQILQISSKRHRDSASSLLPNTLTPHLPSSSGLEVGNFPAEVSSNAVFRCVRVSSVDSADDQYAYQTAVSIGGHLFKGILLDHGPETTTTTTNYSTSTIGGGGGGETSSGGVGGGGGGISQPLDLIATSAATTPAGHQVTQFVDPSALYQVVQPINAYAIAGTQFFLPPRS